MSKISEMQDERCKYYAEETMQDAERLTGSTLKTIEQRIGVINYGKIESLIYGLMKCAEIKGETRHKLEVIEQSNMRFKKETQLSEKAIEEKMSSKDKEEVNKDIMSKWESGKITHTRAVALYNENNGTAISRQQFVVEARKRGFSKSLRQLREKGEISW